MALYGFKGRVARKLVLLVAFMPLYRNNSTVFSENRPEASRNFWELQVKILFSNLASARNSSFYHLDVSLSCPPMEHPLLLLSCFLAGLKKLENEMHNNFYTMIAVLLFHM